MKLFLLVGMGIGIGIWASAVWRMAMENARRTLRDQQRRRQQRIGEL